MCDPAPVNVRVDPSLRARWDAEAAARAKELSDPLRDPSGFDPSTNEWRGPYDPNSPRDVTLAKAMGERKRIMEAGGFDALTDDKADAALRGAMSARSARARRGSGANSFLGRAFDPTTPLGRGSVLGDY